MDVFYIRTRAGIVYRVRVKSTAGIAQSSLSLDNHLIPEQTSGSSEIVYVFTAPQVGGVTATVYAHPFAEYRFLLSREE